METIFGSFSGRRLHLSFHIYENQIEIPLLRRDDLRQDGEMKAGTLAGTAIQPDLSSYRLNQPLADSQTEADPVPLLSS